MSVHLFWILLPKNFRRLSPFS